MTSMNHTATTPTPWMSNAGASPASESDHNMSFISKTQQQHQQHQQQQHQQQQHNNNSNNIDNDNGNSNGHLETHMVMKEQVNNQVSLNIDELNNWTDFTNINELDFNIFDEHINMLNNGHVDREKPHAHPQDGTVPHHDFTEFSYTVFSPVSSKAAVLGKDNDNSNIAPQEESQTLVRTDLIFTPLISPLFTPLDKTTPMMHPQLQSYNRHNSLQSSRRQKLPQLSDSNGMFSPLTSPLLEFQQVKSSPIMRIKKEQTDESFNSFNNGRRSSITQRNSNATPTVPGRVTKQSPVVKPKRLQSTSYANKYLAGDIKLPESSVDFKTPTMVPKRYKDNNKQMQLQIQEQQRLKQQKQDENDTGEHPVTPAILMNFKIENNEQLQMQQLQQLLQQQLQQQLQLELDYQQQSDKSQQYQQTVILNRNHSHSSSSSPVILPSSTTPVMGPRRSSSINAARRDSSSSMINSNGFLPESMMSIPQGEDQPVENQFDKKTNHKLAEQGRRNRINSLIQTLDKLIPMEWKKDVLVPSKLTTIEIAIEYLKHLQKGQDQSSV